jgi:hypothetical protein
LQKYWASNLIKKFIFNSFFLFNDRFGFDKITYYLIDCFIWSKNYFFIQNVKSISNIFQFLFNLIIFYVLILIF